MWEEITNIAMWKAASPYFPGAASIKGFITGSLFTGIFGKYIERLWKKVDESAVGKKKQLIKELEAINAQVLPLWRSASNYYLAPSAEGVVLSQKIKGDAKQLALQWAVSKKSLEQFAPKVTLDNQVLVNFRQSLTYGLDVARNAPLPLDHPRHATMENGAQEMLAALTQACIKLA